MNHEKHESHEKKSEDYFFRASAEDFKKIPGCPVAYWISERIRKLFIQCKSLGEVGTPRLGMATGNNDIYVRNWPEVSIKNVGLGYQSRLLVQKSAKKWFPYNKGGPFRRWYGNNDNLVNWENDGDALQNTLHPSGNRIWAHNFNLDYIFNPCLTFTATSSSYFGIRYSNEGFLFDNKGSSYFTETKQLLPILGFLASKPATQILRAINPTIEFQPGDISVLPFAEDVVSTNTNERITKIVGISKDDWDAYEISWDFTRHTFLHPDYCQPDLEATYQKIHIHWQ